MMIWIATIGAFIGGIVVGFLLTIRWINSILRNPEKIMGIAGIQGKDSKKALALLFGNKGGKKDEK